MALRLQCFMDDRRGHGRLNNLEIQLKVNNWYDTNSPIAPVDIASVPKVATTENDDCFMQFIIYDDPNWINPNP